MKKFIKQYGLLTISFLIMCSCQRKTYKGIDYSEIGGMDLVTYQIPGDKPHQYVRFGYGGAHYPECKYCKENKDTINGEK